MRDEITPESVASEVFILREDDDYQGVFLFVEGETDIAFFSSRIDSSNCQIRMLRGKENVFRVISIIEAHGDDCSLAIVDADFDHIERKKPISPNIFITDTHDIETMILKSPAFEKIVNEYFLPNKISVLKQKYKDIRLPILKIASRIAIIRLANHKFHFGLNFYIDQFQTQTIEWEEAIDFSLCEVNFEKLLSIICNSNCIYNKRFIREKCYKLGSGKYDYYELCNGHDVMYVILLFIKFAGRRGFVENHSIKDIERDFRLAYENQFFLTTNLCSDVITWQENKKSKFLKL